MPTKFERIFRLARRLMIDEGLTAKPAIQKALEVDCEGAEGLPTKEYFAFVREMKRGIQGAKKDKSK